jgi:hypothetical protein
VVHVDQGHPDDNFYGAITAIGLEGREFEVNFAGPFDAMDIRSLTPEEMGMRSIREEDD